MKKNYRSIMNLFRKYLFYIHKSAYFALCLKEVYVSHSKRRTKRTFDLNLFNKKFYYVEQDCWISLSLCAAGLRIINKKGLDAALNDAVAKGYCDWKTIKVVG